MAGRHLVSGTGRLRPKRSALSCVRCGGPSRWLVALARLAAAVRWFAALVGLKNAEIDLGLHQSGLTRVSLRVTESFAVPRAGRRLTALSLGHSSGRMHITSLVDPGMPLPVLMWVLRLLAEASLDPAPVEHGGIAFRFEAGTLLHVTPRPSFTPGDLDDAMRASAPGCAGGGVEWA
ncbi:MAG: hypothetical protein FJ276_27450 [Planctomycetes bacterium]|nr:hypothetical protein [Planctomycetota bacterium]